MKIIGKEIKAAIPSQAQAKYGHQGIGKRISFSEILFRASKLWHGQFNLKKHVYTLHFCHTHISCSYCSLCKYSSGMINYTVERE